MLYKNNIKKEPGAFLRGSFRSLEMMLVMHVGVSNHPNIRIEFLQNNLYVSMCTWSTQSIYRPNRLIYVFFPKIDIRSIEKRYVW